MRLISLNVERSKHLDRIVPFLRTAQPDVVCLQELAAPDIDTIQNATGLAHCHYVPMAIHPGDRLPFGIAILARNPLVAPDAAEYAGTGNGTLLFDRATADSKLSTCRYAVARARLTVAGHEFCVGTTHFPWTPDGQLRAFQAEAVERLIHKLGQDAIVLTGDFNAPRGGPIFDTLARVWTDWVPADVTTSLDPLLHRAGPLELMVDGLFASRHYRVDEVRLQAGLSDHQAISARLQPAL